MQRIVLQIKRLFDDVKMGPKIFAGSVIMKILKLMTVCWIQPWSSDALFYGCNTIDLVIFAMNFVAPTTNGIELHKRF